MEKREGIRGPALHATAIAIAATALWILEVIEPPSTEFNFGALLVPVFLAAFASFVIGILVRARGSEGLRQMLRLPGELGPRLASTLQLNVFVLRAVTWLAILLSASLSIAGTQPDPRIYYNLISGLAGLFVFVAMVRASNVPFPAARRIFPVPWVRLGIFVTAYLLLHTGGLTEHGFPNNQLILALWFALAASYAGGCFGKAAEIEERRPEQRSWPPPAALIRVVAALLAGTSMALLAWGFLGSLPNLNALLLNQWPNLFIGYSTQPYFSQFYEARHLFAFLVVGLYFVFKLPQGTEPSQWADYMVLAKALGYGAVGALAWFVGSGMTDLGQGFPLLGATLASGFFAAGLSHMARMYTSNPVWFVGATAKLLSKSVYRTAFLGAFLALYGLLVRPLMYDVMWFAPIYEWLAIVLFSFVAINRMRSHAKTQVLPGGGPPAKWPGWSRHVQVAEERRDPRLDSLVDLQTLYIETGHWYNLWRYMLGLLIRSRAPVEEIPAVFAPIRRNFEASPIRGPLPGKKARERRGRAAALAETLRRMNSALALDTVPFAEISEEQVKSAAERFANDGANPEVLAVTLSMAYWQRGAPLELAVGLWFPLLTMAGRSRGGLLSFARSAEGPEQRHRERRKRITEAALTHLFGQGNARSLPFAILAAPAPIYNRSMRYFSSNIPQGEAIEVLSQEGEWWRVRAGDDRRISITPAGVARRRIFPGE